MQEAELGMADQGPHSPSSLLAVAPRCVAQVLVPLTPQEDVSSFRGRQTPTFGSLWACVSPAGRAQGWEVGAGLLPEVGLKPHEPFPCRLNHSAPASNDCIAHGMPSGSVDICCHTASPPSLALLPGGRPGGRMTMGPSLPHCSSHSFWSILGETTPSPC